MKTNAIYSHYQQKMVLAKEENENSHSITEPLLQAIMQQKRDGMDECTADTMKIRQDLKVQKRKANTREIGRSPQRGYNQHEISHGSRYGEGSIKLVECSTY